ncbi:MAG TPA: site-2 protease family protein [Fimbriimonadaceae bacterium]|nr:site-2 protease family protein [Fimbriimonadaceae bacterium]
MKWSLRLGRIAGIDIYVHATFAILLIWLVGSEYLSHQSAASILSTTAFVLLIFLIIVLHELGHALAARRYGVETQDIILLPIGGVARLNKIPEEPRQELVVALAGPLVNLVIAAGLFVGILASGTLKTILVPGDFVAQLLWVNIFLAFFNLLPAFPMDGGRALRALLAMKVSRERATEIAVSIGHVMALLFGAVGLLVINNPFLIFIAFFVWIGADAELQQVRAHAFLKGISASEVMARDFETIDARAELGQLAKRFVPGFQSEFPVLDGDRLVGFISLEDVARGVAAAGPHAQVGAYMQTHFESVAPSDRLEELMADWKPGSSLAVAVMESGKLVGFVTTANVGEFMMIQAAMDRSAHR